MESNHDSLFSSEDEALEHNDSDSEIDTISEEESNDDDTLTLARQWFRVQQDASPLPSFVFTEVPDIKNIDVSDYSCLNSFEFFFDQFF